MAYLVLVRLGKARFTENVFKPELSCYNFAINALYLSRYESFSFGCSRACRVD